MLDKNEIISVLRELKPFLQSEFAVKEIGLFGSFSNETSDKDSDIDLLVELEKPIGWKFFHLKYTLRKNWDERLIW
jgi:uncharacterized protein